MAIEVVTRNPLRIAGSAAGRTILRTIDAVRQAEALAHPDQPARHVVHPAGGRDHGREEHAERQGRQLRPLADAEPDDEQRHQRDLRDRKQRRHHRHAGRAQHRPQPDRQPHADPEHGPDVQPIASRISEADRCRHNSPLTVSAHSARAIDTGAGRNSVGISPAEAPACHSATHHAQPASRRGRPGHRSVAGPKPPPRKRHWGRQAGASRRSRSATAASSRIIRHSRCSSAMQIRVGGVASGQRPVDPQHVAHLARAARQHDDLVTQPDGLGQVVGDIDRGRAGGGDQRGELLQQQVAGLRIQGRQRLVQQQARRAHRQRPGDADALPHAAGQLPGPGVGELGQAGQRQHLGHPRGAGRSGSAGPPAPARRCRRRVRQGSSEKVLEHVGQRVQAVRRHFAVAADSCRRMAPACRR